MVKFYTKSLNMMKFLGSRGRGEGTLYSGGTWIVVGQRTHCIRSAPKITELWHTHTFISYSIKHLPSCFSEWSFSEVIMVSNQFSFKLYVKICNFESRLFVELKLFGIMEPNNWYNLTTVLLYIICFLLCSSKLSHKLASFKRIP